MYSIIDNLIFPAPKSSYDYESLKGRIIFVPKFETYKPQYNFQRDSTKTQKEIDDTLVQNENAE